jgi:heme/copper-type cytochrome/quinol oxidase subunit 2
MFRGGAWQDMMARRDFGNRAASAAGISSVVIGAGASGLLLAVPGAAAAADLVAGAEVGASRNAFDVHTLVLCVCVALLVGAFGAMFYSVYAFRRTNMAGAPQWHKNAMVEVMWTVVPVFILFGSAWPAMRTVLDANQKAMPAIAAASPTVVKRYGGAVPVALTTSPVALIADVAIVRR